MLSTKWGLWAIVMELTAWAGPVLLDGHSDAALLSYLLAHAAACVLARAISHVDTLIDLAAP